MVYFTTFKSKVAIKNISNFIISCCFFLLISIKIQIHQKYKAQILPKDNFCDLEFKYLLHEYFCFKKVFSYGYYS